MQLPDGRTLFWAEFGQPSGVPLFLFHGWPESRLVGSYFDEAARDLGVRIICPDRPGVWPLCASLRAAHHRLAKRCRRTRRSVECRAIHGGRKVGRWTLRSRVRRGHD
jgi:hypothetical protein